jgi:hypothetical protein
MHNLSDQELDRLSKDAAEKISADPAPALWDKLQQRLDVEMPVKKKDKRRFFWVLGVTGLSLFLSYFFYQNYNKTTEKLIQATEVGPLVPVAGLDKIKSENNTKDLDQTSSSDRSLQNEKSDIRAITSFPGKVKTPGRQTIQDGLVKQVNQASEKIIFKQKILEADESSNSKTSVKVPENLLQDSTRISMEETSGQTAGTKPDSVEKQLVIILPPISAEINKETVSAATDTTIGMKVNSNKASVSGNVASTVNDDSPKVRRWELGFVFGPDFSNVGFASPDETGMNLGLMVGYRITERLSVQTGLLYSQKHYTSVGDDYRGFPGYNPVNPNVKMQWVQANCFMWDMPVNIRYDWLLRKKQRAFLSTGLSSYFMNKEDLHYHYTYYNSPGYKSWINQENSSYWMAAVNISVGFEQRISSLFSVQAEPFFKIPTGQIGYGNINLNSFGMFLSFKYNPVPFRFQNNKKR